MKEKARLLIENLGFGECLILYEQLPCGNPIIDVVFDRMEEIDPEKFEQFLDGKEF